MDRITGKLTVFFEEPFWVGVFERSEGRKLSVCKVTFGAETKIYGVYDFLLGEYSKVKFGPEHEQMKVERKVISREMKEAEKQRRFEQKQQKRKEKHKGH
ncbi:MAG: YjdF family protein [Anaerovoracaceae bacterium]